MIGKCPICKVSTLKQKEYKYLDKPYLPSDIQLKAQNGKIYQYICGSPKKCGEFFVLKYFHEDDPTKPQKQYIEGRGLWNQGQTQKPEKQMYQSTIGAYTREIKKYVDITYIRVLVRERRFSILYPPGRWNEVARLNRKLVKRAQSYGV